MTVEDAIRQWINDKGLTIWDESTFHGWTCRDVGPVVKGTHITLSNRMSVAIGDDGHVQITGSLSRKSYEVHISDPSLFPILDRALDEEDKWIRDGHRAPE